MNSEVTAMLRRVEPELLDVLPASDPGAIHSRRDLRRLNSWMGHSRIVARQLQAAFAAKPARHLLDLGGGDGTFLLKVAQLLGRRWQGTQALIVDRHKLLESQTVAAFAAMGWQIHFAEHEVLDFIKRREAPFCEATVANLVLHHFSESTLRDLFAFAQENTSMFLALEPRRSRLALLFSRAVWLIGCNAVTRHDAPASVIAGFRGSELSQLWPKTEGWSLQEQPAGLFSHLFLARKILG